MLSANFFFPSVPPLYPNPGFAPALKQSLSIALVHFYPLAGRLVTETFQDEHACSVFIDCNKGPGARLTHVTAPGLTKLDILSPDHVPVIVKNFFEFGEEFLNYDGHTRPLLSIQVTELVDGVFIGFTMSHVVVDGTSSMHFMAILSEIFCSNNTSEKLLDVSRVPVYEHGPRIKFPCLRLEKMKTKRGNVSPLRDRVFHFSAASMTMIKAKANKDGSISKNVSSFQGLCSLIWRSITKARNLSIDQKTACNMMINARPRLDPALSDNYFGNYISQVKIISEVDELLSHDFDWGSMRLNDGLKARDDKSIRSTQKWDADFICADISSSDSEEDDIQGPNGVVIGGSARFDIYGIEFGLGKAVAVRMGLGNKSEGKITAHPGCEGGGSVDLEVSLQEDHMASLEMDNEFMFFVS